MPNKEKAIWWFTPSLLEPCDGPWGKLSDFGHDPTAVWKAIIAWAEKLKINKLITGVEPYSSDRVYNQWGFHYVCHFPDDPEARCFDDETIDRNIRTARSICDYGEERGVQIMFHHYNLMAPERWLKARPGLWKKYDAVHDPVWGHRFHNDRLGNLVSNVCWNEPEYKDFLVRCWRELFHNIPSMAGAMVTAGEFNYCGCEACTGGVPAHIFQDTGDKAAAEAQRTRSDRRAEMCIDFIRMFSGIMDELGKKTIIRAWVMNSWKDRLPKNVEYAIKYSVFDACHGGPDPIYKEWLDAGHDIWETVAIEAENCGPVLWHDPEWCETVAAKNNALNTKGCIAHINMQWGHVGHIASFTSSRNITRLMEGLEKQVAGNASEREFSDFFGAEAGPEVLRAAKLIASFPLHMTACVHLRREGFSYGMPPWFDGSQRWPGVLESPSYQPEPWANPDGLTTIYELIRTVAGDPFQYSRLIENSGESCISRCDEIAKWCSQAADILEKCPEPAIPAARSEIKALNASACLAVHAAREHSAVFRARLAWEAVKNLSGTDADTARKTAAEWYEKSIGELNRQIPCGLELSMIYPGLINHIVESGETFNRLTMATRLRIRQEELHRIKTAAGPDWETAMTVHFKDHLPNSIGSGADI